LVVAKELFRHGGIKGLTRSANWVVRDMNAQGGADLSAPSSSKAAVLVVLAGGAIGGAGYLPFSWLTPGGRAVRGAAYGTCLWGMTELLFRTSSQRDREWLADPKRQFPALVAFGALVGWFVDR
jgi:hypothetical protein